MGLLSGLFNAFRKPRAGGDPPSALTQHLSPEVARRIWANPQELRPRTKVYETTVAFTNIVGLANAAEQDRPEDHVGRMIRAMDLVADVAGEHKAIVERFSGDRAKLAFGLPVAEPDHAPHAVAAVLAIAEAIRASGGHLAARSGVATGELAAGSLSGGRQLAYGTAGYAVYVAERLEPANRDLGTSVLVSPRTAELASRQFFFRPVGRLKLADLSSPVMAYEPLGRAGAMTDAQRRLGEETRQVVEHFAAGRFEQCLQAVVRLEHAGGAGKLTELYLSLIAKHLREPPGADFDGRVQVGGSE